MASDLNARIGEFTADDYTVKLVGAVCAVVPFAPDLPAYSSLEAHLLAREPKAKKSQLDRAKELAAADGAQRALWVANALDTADGGIAVFSGLSTAVNLYRNQTGQRLDALETDPQQAADAVLKGLGLAYLIWKLFPGGPTEKVAAFRALPSGQALIFYYAAVELGLPFADNALTGGGSLLSSLYAKYGPDQTSKFSAIAGAEAAQGATAVMGELLGPVDSMVKMASGSLGAIADAATAYLPGALNVGDKLAGVVASAADALPVYRYLGARVVAEAVAHQALTEVPVDQPIGRGSNPALDEIKYTTRQRGKHDIEVPKPVAKRGGCFLFGVTLLAIGLGGSTALWTVWA